MCGYYVFQRSINVLIAASLSNSRQNCYTRVQIIYAKIAVVVRRTSPITSSYYSITAHIHDDKNLSTMHLRASTNRGLAAALLFVLLAAGNTCGAQQLEAVSDDDLVHMIKSEDYVIVLFCKFSLLSATAVRITRAYCEQPRRTATTVTATRRSW